MSLAGCAVCMFRVDESPGCKLTELTGAPPTAKTGAGSDPVLELPLCAETETPPAGPAAVTTLLIPGGDGVPPPPPPQPGSSSEINSTDENAAYSRHVRHGRSVEPDINLNGERSVFMVSGARQDGKSGWG